MIRCPELQPFQHIGVQRVVADKVHGTLVHLFAVGAAVIVTRMVSLVLPCEVLSESNFNMLSERYQAEQAELDEKIAALKSAMESADQSAEDAEKWVKLIRQYNVPFSSPVLSSALKEPLP